MKTTIFSFCVCALIAAGILGFSLQASAFTDAEKKELGSIIETYILDNPDIVIRAYDKHRANEEALKQQTAADFIKNNKEALSGDHLPFAGNPKGDVTIVEFFDYNCGYCKRALPDLVSLLGDDKNLRVVFHEMPILSADSRTAALWALAAHKQGKYFEYHQALMAHRGAKNEETLSKLGADLGLDVEKLKVDAGSDAVAQELQSGVDIARQIGVTGTPAFIVGDQFYGGYIGHDGLISAIKEARAK